MLDRLASEATIRHGKRVRAGDIAAVMIQWMRSRLLELPADSAPVAGMPDDLTRATLSGVARVLVDKEGCDSA